ncbi:MAG: DUF1624 domain-containing protein [Bacteroidales bacterium]|nr:DUF1624 domain-containing protein [Bacteroidales bacterium]
MGQAKSTRYVALDVLRGMTVAGMILVNNPGSWGHIFKPLRHASWAGCTPTDLVFPFFLFVVGAAMAFSFAKYNESLSGASIKKLVKRGCLIFLVGLLLNAFPFIKFPVDQELGFWGSVAYKFEHLRIFGVLQRIALCYIFGGFFALLLKKPKKIVTAMVILSLLEILVLWLLRDGEGAFLFGETVKDTMAGRASGAFDVNLFNSLGLIGDNHVYHGEGFAFDPEGLIGVLSGSCTVLLGFLVGNICRTSTDKTTSVAKLFVIGMFCLGLGMIASIWVPIVKKIWTGSYVLYAGGWAILMLAFFIYFIDVKGKEKFFTPFKALGMNPLFAFVMAGLFSKILGGMIRWTVPALQDDGTMGEKSYSALSWFYQHICQPVFGGNNEYASLMYAIIYVLVFTLMAYVLYRKKIVIKI